MSLRPRAETAVRRLRWKSDFEKKCLVRVALIFARPVIGFCPVLTAPVDGAGCQF
jgi:hypothetical protein